jgi:serine/threonine protein kinase
MHIYTCIHTHRSVFLALDLHHNAEVAVKRASAAPVSEQEDHGIPVTLIRETGLLRALKHPHIVSLRDKIITLSRVFLVFELCDCNLG